MSAIKTNGSLPDKKRLPVNQHKGAAESKSNSSNKAFLSVAPALPVLSSSLRPPRLNRRSHSIVSDSVPGEKSSGKNDKAGEEMVQIDSLQDGRVQATRTESCREKYPDRISIDRRGLTAVPLLLNETKLRLFSLQHNLLLKLDGISTCGLTPSRLVFLDLYDNQVERISGLDALENLRVLLLGKNRIRRIEGVRRLTKLEVLDLHGNQLVSAAGLNCLTDLKVLNLAGNRLRSLSPSDLSGLRLLRELNLRRNRLRKILGLQHTQHLEKLFLSNNDFHCIEDMLSIARSSQLREVSVDGNPVAKSADCASFLIAYLPKLGLLSNAQVSDAARKAALIWRSSKEASNVIFMKLSAETEVDSRRDDVIMNARNNWEQFRSDTESQIESPPQDSPVSNGMTDGVLVQPVTPAPTPTQKPPRRPLRSSSVAGAGPAPAPAPAPAQTPSIPVRSDRRRPALRRTVSQDTDTSSLTNTSNSVELFRLPPILAPLLGFPEEQSNQNTKSSNGMTPSNEQRCLPRRCDSLSSVEPVVDSSLSSLASESSASDEESAHSSGEGQSNLGPNSVTNRERERVLSATGPRRSLLRARGPQRPSTVRPRPVRPNSVTQMPLNPQDSNLGQQSLLLLQQQQQQQSPSSNQQSVLPARVKEQGGDYLVEISGRQLNVFGQGALRYVDRQWPAGRAADVTSVSFSYVSFDGLAPLFGRLRARFPNVEHFTFIGTNIYCLGQLNALAEVQGLSSLVIEEEGNPLTSRSWQKYAIFRLAHWGLRSIDHQEVTEEMMAEAAEEFKGLSELVLRALPDSLLQPLLTRLRLDTAQPAPLSARQWLWEADPALRSVVAKETLQWRRNTLSQDETAVRQRGKQQLGALLETGVNAVAKLKKLEEMWPVMLTEMLRHTLVDYSQLNLYMKKCMSSLQQDE